LGKSIVGVKEIATEPGGLGQTREYDGTKRQRKLFVLLRDDVARLEVVFEYDSWLPMLLAPLVFSA